MWRLSLIPKAAPRKGRWLRSSIAPNWSLNTSGRTFSAKNRKRKGEKRRIRQALKQQHDQQPPAAPIPQPLYHPAPMVAQTKNSTAAPPVIFSSDFDDRCAVYVSSLLDRFPVTLKRTLDFGVGIFASRDIMPMARGSEVNFENPAFAVTQSIVDRLEEAHIDGDPLVLGSNSLIVAAMVEETLASTQYPCKPSEYLPIRCLGSIPKERKTVETAFQLIGNAYQLPSSVWTEEECLLLHNKVATNKIGDNDLYIATSMFNHSCEFNVAWSPSEPLRRLIAIKPIQKGEQLFITYCDEIDPVKRHAYLLEQFGFHCTCAVCKKVGLV